ncbi:kinase-like protein [Macrolepiota fuliginosa MF-IS2]|uniref:Kinase-like protein n=1 Tax=Macrolepiota fuliginosa MF-IS2 TaxID=1400762 RepID=A0A9P5X7Z2_9AGAR|nr:kinase-like protein [Macrolepiota fuliginosa MF-IS2]
MGAGIWDLDLFGFVNYRESRRKNVWRLIWEAPRVKQSRIWWRERRWASPKFVYDIFETQRGFLKSWVSTGCINSTALPLSFGFPPFLFASHRACDRETPNRHQNPDPLLSLCLAFHHTIATMVISTSAPVDQCYQVKCESCGKVTWKGCGKHVESISGPSINLDWIGRRMVVLASEGAAAIVMKDVAEEDKCNFHHHTHSILYDPPGVTMTDKLSANIADGRPMLNNYTRYARIGNGHHGEVFLCFRIDARFPINDVRRWFPVAMKSVRRDTVIDKYSRLKANRIALTNPGMSELAVVDKLNTTELKIKKEIAIMKKLRHPNVVRLFEVIDDRMKEKVYMVMEYLGGGEIKWRTDNEEPTLTLAQTRRIMRDAILGLEYLHHQGIIHRDIKPANLLWTEDRHHVKIADFGVSHFSYAQRLAEAGEEGVNQDELEEIFMDESDLTKRAGTPAFLAPELIFEHFEEKNKHFVMSSLVTKFSSKQPAKPRITKAIDVWALGVTLYCLLFGKTPFLNVTEGGTTEFALYRAICNKDWEVPEFMCKDKVATGGRHPKKSNKHKQPEGAKIINILERFLQKDQTKRITLDEVKRHQWITEDLLNPKEWSSLTSPARRDKVEVTKSDMFMAVSSVHFRWGFGGFGRGMSALFKPLKARSRTSPRVRYSRNVGVKSDPTAGRLLFQGGSAKGRAAAGVVHDVHAYGRPDGGKVDKGKRRAIEPDVSQPSSPGAASTTSSSPALDAIRRQHSEMGFLGHELEQRRVESSGSGSGSAAAAADGGTHQDGTPVDPAPKLEDIMSIVTWRPTKYPTPTTSLTPLLANIHATSTFRTPPRPRKTLVVGDPITGGPARTVSTLEGGLRPAEDMLGIYGPDGGMVPYPTALALNNFKRASSWGQGDEIPIGGGTHGGGDVVSVTSVGVELNETVKLMGAGGVESLGSPVSPASPGGSVGLSMSVSAGSGSGRESGGWRVTASGSGSAGAEVNGNGNGNGNGVRWDELGEGIRKWRDYRKKHHQRNASSSTLPWVESLDDLTFDGTNNFDGTNGGAPLAPTTPAPKGNGISPSKGARRQVQTQESRGELTIEWMDDNYSTPGGYYGTSMGPATQFWRHGPGGGTSASGSNRAPWSGSPTMTRSESMSSCSVEGPVAGSSRGMEVVRRRDVSLDKFLSGESDEDEDEDEVEERVFLKNGSSNEGSDYGEVKRRYVHYDDDEDEEEEEDERLVESESDDDEDEHAQQITIKSKLKGKLFGRH